MEKTSKSKAERELNRRLEYSGMKRFNDPLKCYIERKHPEIFKEYKEFYQYLNTLNPKLKNLTKSKQFKDWENNLTFIPLDLEPNLEAELMPLELAKINMRLRKVETSLQSMKQNEPEVVTNESEAATNEIVMNEGESEAATNEIVMNEGEAFNPPTEVVTNKDEAFNLPTLESMMDELLEDDAWQEMLNQDLSEVYTQIETYGGF